MAALNGEEWEFARRNVTTRCCHCVSGRVKLRGWKYVGTLHDGQERLAEHRRVAHPDLPSLEEARTASVRVLRGTRRGLLRNHVNRDDATAEELAERERLRRLARSDLPALAPAET